MKALRTTVYGMVVACCLFTTTQAVFADSASEEERSIVGVWITGEDIDITYTFCEDGTFTHWVTNYYFKKDNAAETNRYRVGCGEYSIGRDAVSATLDLYYQHDVRGLALGRFQWVDAPYGVLSLNLGELGAPRPDSPLGYGMRSGGIQDCACVSSGTCVAVPVAMTALSGQYGYALQGEHGFTGTLTKDTLRNFPWRLQGEFEFPTGGYAVANVEVSVAESYPEQVSVTMHVTEPSPDTMVTEAIVNIPVSTDIYASSEATFTIRTRTCVRGGMGEGEPVEGEGEVVEGEGEPAEGEPEEGEGKPAEGEDAPMTDRQRAERLLEHFDDADADANGGLDMEEAISVLPDLGEEQFNRLDTDGNGVLSREELEGVAEPSGFCNGFVPVMQIKRCLGDVLLLGLSIAVLLIVAEKPR